MKKLIIPGIIALVALAAGVTIHAAKSQDGNQSETKQTKTKKEITMEVTLTKENFEQEVLKADRPVLVDFWAPWCGPCRMLGPIVAEVATERAATLKVGKLNVDEAGELAAKYGITSIPAVFLFKGGKVVGTSVGYVSKPDLLAFVDKYAGSAQ